LYLYSNLNAVEIAKAGKCGRLLQKGGINDYFAILQDDWKIIHVKRSVTYDDRRRTVRLGNAFPLDNLADNRFFS